MSAEFKTPMPAVPEWMLNTDDNDTTVKNNTHFLRRTLNAFSGVFQNEFLSEKYASKAGFLQSVDPRVKLLTLLFFVIFSACVSKLVVIIALGLVAVLFAGFSGLSVSDFLRRVWLYLPTLILIVSLPAATNLVIKGQPLFFIVKTLSLRRRAYILLQTDWSPHSGLLCDAEFHFLSDI